MLHSGMEWDIILMRLPETNFNRSLEAAYISKLEVEGKDVRFRGTYSHTVDSKGRVSLPAKFRKELPENVVIVPGFGKSLYVFSEENFDKWVDSFFEHGEGAYDPKKREDVFMRKKLYNNAEDVSVDSVGRITISSKTREAALIKKNVYIVGDSDHIEIWDRDNYDNTMSKYSLDDFLEA